MVVRGSRGWEMAVGVSLMLAKSSTSHALGLGGLLIFQDLSRVFLVQFSSSLYSSEYYLCVHKWQHRDGRGQMFFCFELNF